jgi:alanine racemase
VEATLALELAGAGTVAVALVEEGVKLREGGVQCDVLILGASLPDQSDEIVQRRLTQTVCAMEVAESLSKAAERQRKKAKVEIKVDTGMGRLGIRPESAPEFLEGCLALPRVEVVGMWSHLATADEQDRSYTEAQFQRFQPCLRLREKAKQLRFHLCNSAGIVKYPEMWLDGVRPGLLTYGLKPFPRQARDGASAQAWADRTPAKEKVEVPYRPAMALKSRLNFVKKVRPGESLSYGRTFVADSEMLVGTVPVGYGDGYPRALSNRGLVLFRGERARIVGRVCMDQFLVDLTRFPDAKMGEEVVLIGRQRDSEISANEVAEWAGTIVNEIVCRMGERLPRIYE